MAGGDSHAKSLCQFIQGKKQNKNPAILSNRLFSHGTDDNFDTDVSCLSGSDMDAALPLRFFFFKFLFLFGSAGNEPTEGLEERKWGEGYRGWEGYLKTILSVDPLWAKQRIGPY